MNLLLKLIFMIPCVKKMQQENEKLKKACKMYFLMYQQQSEKVSAYQDTLDEIVSTLPQSKKQTVKKNAPVQKNKTLTFTKENETTDETVLLAEELVNKNPFGMAASDYDGEPVKYQELTNEMIEGLFQYCYENPTKEVNLELGDINGRITGILESHRDNELSVEIYEDGKHLESFKTGKKEINDEVISDYDESDIIRVLNSYGKKGLN